MPIAFRSPASSALLNSTFVDKTIDDNKKGKLGLFKVNQGESGAVEDVQEYLNEMAQNIGQDGEGDELANVYANENFIENGQNRKQAIEVLDAQLSETNNRSLQNQGDIAQLNDRVTQEVERLDARIDLGAFKQASFEDDSAYEEQFTAEPGSSYFNTTTNQIRIYDGEWKNQNSEIPVVDYRYWGNESTDGSWRMGVVDGAFVIEVRTAGVWVTKDTINP
jgi:hypothetical protein